MNHIARITAERREALEQLRDARAMLCELEAYLMSAKFSAPGADYVHVRTDLLPKLARLRGALLEA